LNSCYFIVGRPGKQTVPEGSSLHVLEITEIRLRVLLKQRNVLYLMQWQLHKIISFSVTLQGTKLC